MRLENVYLTPPFCSTQYYPTKDIGIWKASEVEATDSLVKANQLQWVHVRPLKRDFEKNIVI